MTKHVQFLELLIGPLANEGGGGGSATLINKSVSANGTYNASSDNADGYKKVTVDVQPDLQSKSVTIQQNGQTTVSPDQGKDGLSSVGVTVNVQPDLQSKSVTIQQNGTTNVAPDQGKDGLSGVEITVNVSGGGGGGDVCDFANDYIGGGFTGELKDSTDPNVTKVTSVKQYALETVDGLTGVDLRQCTTVNQYAFSHCSGLKKVNLPACTTLGSYAFYDSVHVLEELNLPLVEGLPSSAFAPASNAGANAIIDKLYFPALKTNTGGILRFTKLTAIRLGSAVTTISGSAFRYCTELSTLIFGASLAAVPTLSGTSAFQSSSLTTNYAKIYVPSALVENFKTATGWSTYAAHIDALENIPAWSAGSYSKGNVVKHSGHYWRCNNSSGTSDEPTAASADWQDLWAI